MKTEMITIRANGEAVRVPPATTIGQYLAGCGWKPTQVVVEQNGQVLERGKLCEVRLQPGDSLEIVIPVAGG
jgi:thiamine biosynthesis protein ThiS